MNPPPIILLPSVPESELPCPNRLSSPQLERGQNPPPVPWTGSALQHSSPRERSVRCLETARDTDQQCQGIIRRQAQRRETRCVQSVYL